MTTRPDVVLLLTDEERAAPSYESDALTAWRHEVLAGRRWFTEHGTTFARHYTASLACVPSRPSLLTGHYPDVHGLSQTNGLGKADDDSRMRWLRPGEVPTVGHFFRAAGYDTHYDGKWHVTHADLVDPATGGSLATNDDDGTVDPAAVKAYLDADPLDEFGFSGWVGPEPHGAKLSDAGIRRDPLIADRVVAWLEDRYARRRAGDPEAMRPFLLVASFVNPHDIVLFPLWLRTGKLPPASPADPPRVPPSPTDSEDLATKPAAQVAYRDAYYSAYGPAPAVERIYAKGAQRYRDLYYRLHAEVDGPLDRVRRAVTEGGSEHAVVVRTADHGDLLGSHGGLHQKWFTLYDEATRVPMQIVRVVNGEVQPSPHTVADVPTSHVDVVPTLLGAAGIDEGDVAAELASDFTEVHPLPGRDLLPLVDGGVAAGDRHRAVYLMTRDNMMEGDSLASGVARRLGRLAPMASPPVPLRIAVPAHVGNTFEAIVSRVDDNDAPGAGGHLYKLVRTSDDPAVWTEPNVRHLAASGPAGLSWRSTPLVDEWELYDLDDDPIEAHNLAHGAEATPLLDHLRQRLVDERSSVVPERNVPWPCARRHPIGGPERKAPPPPARLARALLRRMGMHPHDPVRSDVELPGRRALVVCTNHAVLDVGKATGVFASELTVPYYAFRDAGMTVDVASPLGGVVPIDPLSLRAVLRTEADDRFLIDEVARTQVTHSLAVGDLDMADYDLVYLAGGWGASFDLGDSAALGDAISEGYALGRVIGGVCHGPLGLIRAVTPDGAPLVEGRRISAVTDKQVRELGITSTPRHPETELRRLGARFEAATARRDPFANHWVVDDTLVTGQNQNAAPMVAREMLALVAAREHVADGERDEPLTGARS
ncbi:MAG: sulfatase-like hydrolase/transferase [Acidimicrobiia bacterium]|nr:sulfatase-like hydrolase/transferase [Acidimicrobiia bacterium]